jgi:hypothetical protein
MFKTKCIVRQRCTFQCWILLQVRVMVSIVISTNKFTLWIVQYVMPYKYHIFWMFGYFAECNELISFDLFLKNLRTNRLYRVW